MRLTSQAPCIHIITSPHHPFLILLKLSKNPTPFSTNLDGVPTLSPDPKDSTGVAVAPLRPPPSTSLNLSIATFSNESTNLALALSSPVPRQIPTSSLIAPTLSIAASYPARAPSGWPSTSVPISLLRFSANSRAFASRAWRSAASFALGAETERRVEGRRESEGSGEGH